MAGRAAGRATCQNRRALLAPRLRLQSADRLRDEGRSGRQIDIRIKRAGQHEGEPRQAAHVRKPIVPRGPAGNIPDRCLERPHQAHQIGIGIGKHIAGRRQRQDQQPFEQAPSRKLVHRHQPSRRNRNGERHERG